MTFLVTPRNCISPSCFLARLTLLLLHELTRISEFSDYFTINTHFPATSRPFFAGRMSQPSSAVSSSVTDRRALSGDAASYQSELADFTVFPGLKSFAQPLTAQSQPSLSGSTSQTSPQPQPQPDSSSSSGNSDIEKLERLKREILEGQNPIYKAIPQPRFLEKLYLGRSVQRQDFVPAHPDQITKSPPSSNPQVRLTDSAKAGETEPSAKLDSLQESSKAGAEVCSPKHPRISQ